MNNPSPPKPIPFRERLRRLLNRPLFGTVVIPRDARVNPADFPEEEFPIHCGKCGYPLKALPEPRCPECGTPFETGRRIVEEYYRDGQNAKTGWEIINRLAFGELVVGIAGLEFFLMTYLDLSPKLFSAIVIGTTIGAIGIWALTVWITSRQSRDRQGKRDRVRQYLIAQARAAQRGQRNA